MVRVAQLIAAVVTPHCFRSKRQFWSYCGLAVVTRSSADHQVGRARLRRTKKRAATRGAYRSVGGWWRSKNSSGDAGMGEVFP